MERETDILEALRTAPDCGCGRSHYFPVEHVEMGAGALERLAGIVSTWTSGRLCVVSDSNTEQAAAGSVKQMLQGLGIPFAGCVLDADTLEPDEEALGALMLALPGDVSGIVCVGAGTLSDICRFAAWRLGIPCCLVPTALSMDGYAAAGSSIFDRGVKKYFLVGPPEAIVLDTAILSAAPRSLTAGGVAEILAKRVSVPDWRLSQLMGLDTDCAAARELLERAVRNVEETAKDGKADAEQAERLAEALVLSGATVSYLGSTRATAGSEHQIAHYLEMADRRRNGRSTLSHGQAVALGTVAALELFALVPDYLEILGDDPREGFVPLDEAAWEKELRRAYGMEAPVIARLEEHSGQNADSAVLARRAKLIEKREEVLDLIRSLPSADSMRAIFRSWGLETDPAAAGISRKEMRDAILYGKEFRDRYGLLQALFDLGRAEQAAEAVAGA